MITAADCFTSEPVCRETIAKKQETTTMYSLLVQYGVALILVVGAAHMVHNPAVPPSHSQGRVTAAALARQIGHLRGWGETPDYPESAWDQMIEVARVVQRTDPHVVEQALEQFQQAA